jgi:hypothetical protein
MSEQSLRVKGDLIGKTEATGPGRLYARAKIATLKTKKFFYWMLVYRFSVASVDTRYVVLLSLSCKIFDETRGSAIPGKSGPYMQNALELATRQP